MSEIPFPDADPTNHPGAPLLTEFGFADGSWESRLASARRPPDAGTLGDFQLAELIGRGGQGAVYKAIQPGTGRTVAVKRIAVTDDNNERRRERFRREVELAASLHHPGIVTIHGLIDGDSSVVMEWIDGHDAHVWGDAARDKDGGVRRIVSVLRRAADAVAYAHARGIIHRDLKPSNILIDANDQPHVVDFGLARAVEASANMAPHARRTPSITPTLTIDGSFAGTPVYAPPEQIDQGLHEADVRSDVYALGAVLYRLLTGREPFEAPTLAGLFDLIRHGHPTTPSAHNTSADAELDAIVMMAMRARREDRYQTMAGFADDLGRWLDRKAVLAVPTSTMYLARAFVRRHRMGVTLGVLSIVLIVGSGIAAGVAALALARQRASLVRTVQERDTALGDSAVQRARLQAELRKSIGVNMGLMTVLDDMASADPAHRRGLLDAFTRRAAALDALRVPLRPDIEIGNRVQLASMFRMLGDNERSREQVERAIEIGRRRAPGSADLSHALGDAGNLALEQRRYADAVALYEESLSMSGSAFGNEGGEVAQARLCYAEALAGAGRGADAQREIDSLGEPSAAPLIRARAATLVAEACERSGLVVPAWVAQAGAKLVPGVR